VNDDDIQIFESDDAVLLHCRSISTDEEIFGFSDGNAVVHVTKFEPCIDSPNNNGCCCIHPRRDWRRTKREDSSSKISTEKQLTIIDLTKIQSKRRQTSASYPSFDTPGKVFHLLRSVLTCPSGLHCASPWYGQSPCCHDKAVALLVKRPSLTHEFWGNLEQNELNELVNFRTGDAAPSYYLHSTTKLGAGFRQNLFQSGLQSDATLFVFRHLPTRNVLTVGEPKHTDCMTTLEENTTMHLGCLWEKYIEAKPELESDSDDMEKPTKQVIKHRLISPPYLSYEQEYPGLLDAILNNIHQVREEAMKIPQWTAWPEKNHYSSNGDENNPYAAWTVFPLCHTFPANDVSQRKFINTTCAFVPQTTSLLKAIGPKLRTALFSRLDKRTTLGAHRGWSDLANHVLRVHIPLVVPPGGCCGTWVDGW
jgi:hypothetical protein